MPIQAIVFDMDGVLIDSEVIWRRVRETYAAELGRPWTQDDQAAMMGCSTPAWSAGMHERLKISHISVEALAQEIKQRVRRAFEDDLPVRPGVLHALEALGKQYPLALASGSPRELVDCAMRITGFGPFFSSILSGDDVRHGKPHPEIYMRSLEHLGTSAAYTVGIEDSANGLRALQAAGMPAVAAPCPEFPLTPEELFGAQIQINSMQELTPMLIESITKVRVKT
jgi:HAD superfamily hydrolase (TIGR01509 family)